MISEKVIIRNKQGIHLRVASAIVKESNKYRSEIFIVRNSEKASCKSILGLITMAIPFNQEVILEVNGNDEEEAFSKIKESLSKDYSSMIAESASNVTQASNG